VRKYLLEMLIHTPLNTHKEPENIAFIGTDKELYEAELQKQKFLKPSVTYIETMDQLQSVDSSSLDVLIVDTILEDDKRFFAHLNRVLNDKGLLSLNGDLNQLAPVAEEFLIAMPHLVYSFESSTKQLIFGSKFYHPTADIVLQRSDFIDDLSYYNSDIHTSSFVLPNWIKSQIKSSVKN
jgi:spermidine synthase